jgi:hypothetical protein
VNLRLENAASKAGPFAELENTNALEYSKLLPDAVTIADEVDAKGGLACWPSRPETVHFGQTEV